MKVYLIYLICFHIVMGHRNTGQDELEASHYLNSLIEKHSAGLQLEIENVKEDVTLQQAEDDKIWYVGEISISLLDKKSVTSMTNKLERAWRLPWKLLNRFHLPELGLFFLSIGDTNIFDEL
ncbi:hypothetical protein HG537_0H03520 [Torulaspora globosa]|uniref:Uncharacterized protein n=1 Tax=Torulaspora globosa TaxID=48254 RepID=A0A7H9HZM5_9SACH|nr:hypothetical protein HG537_0H03520 [Torulaspora sp. CBS 2947]